MAYKHGPIADFADSIAASIAQTGAAAVYVGTAPVHQVQDYKSKVNKPVKLTDWDQAVSVMGYSDDWRKYTLCEATYAHFSNAKGPVGPIYVINVLDPDIHRALDTTDVSVTFVANKATVVDKDMIVSTFAIGDLVSGVDYSTSYDPISGKLTVTYLKAAAPAEAQSASYYKVSLADVSKGDVIGGALDGKYKGASAVRLLYQMYNKVPTFLAAPGWSHEYDVYKALLNAARKVNGHWDAYVYADLPVKGEVEDDEGLDTRQGAMEYKDSHTYDSERSGVCWPMGLDALGNKYHGSVQYIVETLRLLSAHDDIPYETASNKTVPLTGMYFGEGSTAESFDESEANELNEVGICTLRYWDGSWRLWGGHTAAYRYGADIDPRCVFDTNILMMMHLTNRFQRVWAKDIDKPMTVSKKDEIVVQEGRYLNYLVNYGALLGTPKVTFEAKDNPTSSLVQGDFKFRHLVTPTPQAKSIETGVAYTDAGVASYFGSATTGAEGEVEQ